MGMYGEGNGYPQGLVQRMEQCKSCLTETACNNVGYREDIRADCPCSICIIKVVCQKDCEEFRAFWKKKNFYPFSRAKVSSLTVTTRRNRKVKRK